MNAKISRWKYEEYLPQQGRKDREQNLQGWRHTLQEERSEDIINYLERKGGKKMMWIIEYRYLNELPLLQREPRQKEVEIESRMERLRCSCHYRLYHRDLSEDINMENNYDTVNLAINLILVLFFLASNFRITVQQLGKATLY